MKSIKEAAKEHGLKVHQALDSSVIATRAEDGFKAGVEFAQRWIDVNDELPPIDTEILCKINGYIPFVGRYTGKQNDFRDYSDGNIYDCTHWRPIEYK